MLHPQLVTSRFTKTYDRVKRSFFSDDMKQDVRNFVVECDVCQCNKGEIVKSLGTLQPLSIPPAIWRDISMDFITGLPKSGNKSVIMVVVDHLSKYAHLLCSSTPIYNIHCGSTFHGSGLQASWHAAFYCF
jgi:hypothetical protein